MSPVSPQKMGVCIGDSVIHVIRCHKHLEYVNIPKGCGEQ